jgi:site-specific DNA-methyltransferase (adenine-specific)
MQPTCAVGDARLYHADCRDVLRSMPDNSIHAVVCDPPYALVSIVKRFGKPGSAPAKDVYGRGAAGFMGKQWDTGEVAFSEEFWAEVLRVLKPGGHVVAFSGTRTYHRMAVAIEDAGFEIRDQLGWLYGSGFPKSHNQNGEWEGWGTALKPAWEPIALARKPIEGTVAANLAKWGVGALNVDGCRVGDFVNTTPSGVDRRNAALADAGYRPGSYPMGEKAPGGQTGRWPANIIHDGSDEVLAAFPDAPGQQRAVGPEHGEKESRGIYGDFGAREHFEPRTDSTKSAARFFYCAKASRKDRDEGLEGLPPAVAGVGAMRDGGRESLPRKNVHPTVKPTDLMRWLCRLVTPPGGTILDPFMGSGSTGKAALLEGFRFIGCEREDEYMPIAQARIAAALRPEQQPVAAKAQPAAATPKPANDNQHDLFGEAAA